MLPGRTPAGVPGHRGEEGQDLLHPTGGLWDIYKTLFKYDPNSLVHGVLFAREQIKISSRLLAAHWRRSRPPGRAGRG
jgi:hypothetical protein